MPGTALGPLGFRNPASSSAPGPPEPPHVRSHGNGRMLPWGLIFRREPAHKVVLRIEKLKRHAARWRLQEIVDGGAIWRILCRGFLGRQRRAYKIIIVDTDGSSGMIKECRLRLAGVGCLAQWRNVVENPEGTSMGSNHEVIAMDREIPDRADGQIQLQGLPMIAVIKRNVNPKLGSG